jgi:hypothetical protein
MKISPQTTESDRIIVTHAEREELLEALREVLHSLPYISLAYRPLFDLYSVLRGEVIEPILPFHENGGG